MFFAVACMLLVLALLAHSASVESRRATMRGLLISAVKARDAKHVRELLMAGADPNARERVRSPERYNLVRLVMDKFGQNRLNDGKTALMIASGNLDTEIVRMLLRFGARPNDRDREGNTALIEAASIRSVYEFDHYPYPFDATIDSHLVTSLLDLLISHGADVNAVSDSGCAALSLAIKRTRSAVCVSSLLQHGSQVNSRLALGQTALFEAVACGRPEIVKRLLSYGADPNVHDQCGECPLHVAVAARNPRIVELLLHSGADPNAVDQAGRTPLHLAVYLPADEEIMRLLIRHGANAYVRDSRGETPIAIDEDFRSPGVLRSLGTEPRDKR
jgi:ankyrin repeat protein